MSKLTGDGAIDGQNDLRDQTKGSVSVFTVGCEWALRLTELGFPDVDQHVGIGAVPDREVVIMAAIVVLYGLLLGAP